MDDHERASKYFATMRKTDEPAFNVLRALCEPTNRQHKKKLYDAYCGIFGLSEKEFEKVD